MKNIVVILFTIFLFGCKTSENIISKPNSNLVKVAIDLINVKDDKVMVSVYPPSINTNNTIFYIPKTVPGTYSADDYGKFIEDFKAFDSNGKPLAYTKQDVNSYLISDAQKLHKVTYWVNDTYDIEGTGKHEVFSPAGTNIKANENFMLNTHAFVGYFSNFTNVPYNVSIAHPENLVAITAMTDKDVSNQNDVFVTNRYADLVDMPIMYSKADVATIMADDMEIIIGTYSANGKYSTKDFAPNLEKTLKAQKKFLGKVNDTKKYAILIYLSDVRAKDAKGFGALEHTTSTTVVMPEMMGLEMLNEQLTDIVSHEFFHIVTPLSVHSVEIQDFNFNNPKMSEHLWMYEGVTEYFANLFQVNQGLISETDFYKRMADKIAQANNMNDTMSFTKMSKNVLEEPYKSQYLNVYQKGALIAMCIDIIIRENSNGQKGILNLMQELSNEYGANKAFKDEELFNKITKLTYPQVGEFLNKYVAGETPIPYEEFFAKMGVTNATVEVNGNPFLNGQTPYITVDPSTKEIMILPNIEPNEFMNNLGLKPGDKILKINDVAYNLDNIYDLIMSSTSWKDGDNISVTYKRGDKETNTSGKIIMPKEQQEGYLPTDDNKLLIRNAWIKG